MTHCRVTAEFTGCPGHMSFFLRMSSIASRWLKISEETLMKFANLGGPEALLRRRGDFVRVARWNCLFPGPTNAMIKHQKCRCCSMIIWQESATTLSRPAWSGTQLVNLATMSYHLIWAWVAECPGTLLNHQMVHSRPAKITIIDVWVLAGKNGPLNLHFNKPSHIADIARCSPPLQWWGVVWRWIVPERSSQLQKCARAISSRFCFCRHH